MTPRATLPILAFALLSACAAGPAPAPDGAPAEPPPDGVVGARVEAFGAT